MDLPGENKRTVNSVIAYLEDAVSNKKVIAPSDWLDAAQYLNTLMGDEEDELFRLQQICSKEKVDWIELGKSATEARLRVEASDHHKAMKKQAAKLSRIVEMIRIAKIQAKTRLEEMKGY